MESYFLNNHLLIASPKMEDSVFSGALLLVCEHNEDGAIGIILNRPTSISMNEVFEQFISSKDSNNPIPLAQESAYFGGPVSSERGLVLHENMGKWQYTLDVNNYISLTTSQDIMMAMAYGEGPEKSVFVLGYSGWGKNQLEEEIKDNSWIPIPLSTDSEPTHKFQTDVSIINDLIFNTPAHSKWSKALELIGVNPANLSSECGHA